MVNRLIACVVLAALACSTLAAQAPVDQFVTVNDVRLQYVDWGGTGNAILLLPGLGDDVHRFDRFAPRFTDVFHVVGFSRRGQGASDASSSNYDTATLVEDIRQFLDVMRIERVDIIGHSIAGVEMTRFAALYPARVRHLVFLDAAYDYGRATEVAVKAQLITAPKPPATPLEFIQAEAGRRHPDFAAVRAPALAFFVINSQNPLSV
jgi:non-heme chloroperoxidase